MADRQLPDGSIERTDPESGKKRIISRADAVRTALTRERTEEQSMQAGAPPLAGGPVLPDPDAVTPAAGNPARYQGNNRAGNVARAKADGQFDAKRAQFNATNTATQMDENGEIQPVGKAGDVAVVPLAGATAPTTPSPAASAQPAAPAPAAPVPVAAPRPPRLPEPAPAQAINAAAGPNISTANPNNLPQGSIGMQRADGTYTVETAPGQSQSFANEGAARTYFATKGARPQAMQSAEQLLSRQTSPAPAIRPPALPRADAAPDATSQAWADNSAGRARGGSTVPNLPDSTPVSYVGPAPVQAPQVDMTPRPVATPGVTSPQLTSTLSAIASAPDRRATTPPAGQPRVVGGGAVRRDLARLGEALSVGPETGATLRARREESGRATRENNQVRQVGDRARAMELPDLDAGAVADPEPFDFPSIQPTGSRRARASLA